MIRKMNMEAVAFCGIPVSGISSFYKARLFSSDIRFRLDLLKTCEGRPFSKDLSCRLSNHLNARRWCVSSVFLNAASVFVSIKHSYFIPANSTITQGPVLKNKRQSASCRYIEYRATTLILPNRRCRSEMKIVKLNRRVG